MRKIFLLSVFTGLFLFVFDIGGFSLPEFKKDSFQSARTTDQGGIQSIFLVNNLYAKSDTYQGKGLGQDKGTDKGKGNKYGHYPKKPKKPKKDKGKGPSVPALPMAASVLLGLCAIGLGRLFLRKNKGLN